MGAIAVYVPLDGVGKVVDTGRGPVSRGRRTVSKLKIVQSTTLPSLMDAAHHAGAAKHSHCAQEVRNLTVGDPPACQMPR